MRTPALPLFQQMTRDSVEIGKRTAATISPQTVAPMPMTISLLHQNTEKYPQAKFEKWVGQGAGGEGGKSTTSLRAATPTSSKFLKKSMSKNMCYKGPTPNSTDGGFLKISNFNPFPTQKLSVGSGKMKLLS
ncbi:hypothetical protein RF11_04097 [Thelohanellus kitauei]|uniref:Uncharacterized protein n=1 Tax=Thelohanellus kitauei TaxID=669202 RepID=A0A0C2MFA1_THEKT|nr:hypothetical protein RF11_04097 [Thelohanellus kitauei]